MDKETLRIETKAKIAGFDRVYIEESDCGILRNLISLPEFIAAPRIFSYISIGREADTINFIEYCLKLGKQVALPTDFIDCNMNFALLDCSLSELELGKYGIPAPNPNAERLIPNANDIIVVPALCYDNNFYRLGRGGGYFDKYLSNCRAFSVGICREKLVIPEVPRDIFDISVNCLVTEERIARPI